VIGTRGVERNLLQSSLRPDQVVIDLVNLEKERRLNGPARYEGICW
jgi:hypothetical protein